MRVNPDKHPSTATAGRRYGGVDPDERVRQRRAKLIEAALALFGAQGFHTSTVVDVCREARLSARYFYESFASMESLFQAVYADVTRQLMRETVLALSQCPPIPDRLAEAALRAFFGFIRDDPRRARVTLIDALTVGEPLNSLAGQANQEFAEMVGIFMRRFVPDLDGSSVNVHILADGLVGACNRIATQWVADKCRTPIDEVLGNTLTIFSACFAIVERRTAAPLSPR